MNCTPLPPPPPLPPNEASNFASMPRPSEACFVPLKISRRLQICVLRGLTGMKLSAEQVCSDWPAIFGVVTGIKQPSDGKIKMAYSDRYQCRRTGSMLHSSYNVIDLEKTLKNAEFKTCSRRRWRCREIKFSHLRNNQPFSIGLRPHSFRQLRSKYDGEWETLLGRSVGYSRPRRLRPSQTPFVPRNRRICVVF